MNSLDGIFDDNPSAFIPKGSANLDFPTNALKEANALIAYLDAAIRKPIEESLASAESLVSECRACLEGDLARLTENAESCLRKCGKKLESKCWDVLSSSYAALANAGGAYPTPEDVIYGLETSDYLGSVGLTPRKYAGSTDAVGSPPYSGIGTLPGTDDANDGVVVNLPGPQTDGVGSGFGSVPNVGSGSPGSVSNHVQGGHGSVSQNPAGQLVGQVAGSQPAILEGGPVFVQAASQASRNGLIPACPPTGGNYDVVLSDGPGRTFAARSPSSIPPAPVQPECQLTESGLNLVSGYSQSQTSGGSGFPWQVPTEDVPSNGWYIATITIPMTGGGYQNFTIGWPLGAVLALDGQGNLIYSFGGNGSTAMNCIVPGTLDVIQGESGGGSEPPPPPPPPSVGPENCFDTRTYNITYTVPTNGVGQTVDFTPHPTSGIPVSRPVAESGAMGWGCRWRVKVCNSTVPGGPPEWRNVAAPFGSYPATDPTGQLWFVKSGVPLPAGWKAVPPSMAEDIGGCKPNPPPPGGCNPDFPKCIVELPPMCPPFPPGFLQPGPIPAAPTLCDKWDEYIDEIIKVFVSPANVLAMPFQMSPATGIVADIIGALTGRKAPILPDIINGIGKYIGKACADAAKITGCDISRYLPIVLQQGLSEFVEKWTGSLPEAYMQRLKYMANQVCQYLLPTGPDADASFLMGTIDEEVWKCWHRLNGNQLPEAKLVRESKRTKPNVHEIVTLNVRGHIDDKLTRDLCKELGVTRDEDYDRFKRLVEAFPGIDDIFRLMVRDVADEEIVTKFELDTDFDKKWKGKLKDYAKGQGITDELAKYMWRAHWQYPSNTQAFEALHKLRPTKPGIDPKIVTTSEDIKRLITANDMSPFWVERLMAASYHTLTRVDTTRAYELGVLDKKGVQESYQDGGYNEANALILADVAEVNLKKKRRNALGLPGPKSLFASFVNNEITGQEFSDELAALNFSAEEIGTAVIEAGSQRNRIRRKKRIAVIRKSYLMGGADETTTIKRLNELFLDASQIGSLIDEWTFKKTTETKLASLSQLCTWFTNHLISAEDYLTRLRNLGFAPEDIGRIAASCGIVASEKERKAAEKAAKAAEAALEKQRAKAQKLLQVGETALNKARKEADEAELFAAKMVDKVAASGQATPGEGTGEG